MKSKNMKRFSVGIMVLWTAGCLAQPVYYSGTSQAYVPPSSGSDQQTQAKDLTGKRGEKQVDPFTGSFGYAIPIQCAPARNGSEPGLALSYSSGGDIGWCGMGWRLDIGGIERNGKDGFPLQYSTATPAVPQAAYDDGKGFLLNLFGKEIKLLPTATANEYRAEVDTAFLRCVLDTANNKWLVYDKSGTVYSFGQSTNSQVANPKTGWSGYSGTFYWGLDQIITASGDWTTVAYTNFTSPDTGQPERTLYPLQITYNGHTNFNGYSMSVGGTHTITFGTEIRPDRRFSYRWGFRTEQNRRLTNIVCQAGGQKVWRYALGYALSPATKRSLLNTLTTYGSDDSTALPVQTFNYQGNPKGVSFGPTIKWTNVDLTYPGYANIYDPYLTTVDGAGYTIADLVDIDGDGLPDRVAYDGTNSYFVQKNLGVQANGNILFGPRYRFGPTASSASSVLSAANPVAGSDDTWAALNSQHVRLRDINGDGLPDRVCDYYATYTNSSVSIPYTNYEVMMNAGTGFVAVAMWPVSDGPTNAKANNQLSLYQCVESGGVNTGFYDINGDGLPDRVLSMYYTEGAMIYYRVQFNTGTNFTPVRLFGPYHSQNYNYQTSNNACYYWAGNETPDVHLIDINGDGLPDRVMWPMNPNNLGSESTIATTSTVTTNYCLEFNDGYSFEAVNTSTTVPGAFDVWPGVNSQGNTYSVNYAAMMNLPYVGLYDLNGDGLPDRVMLCVTNTSSPSWLVYLNNGRGFETTPIVVTNIDAQGQSASQGWWAIQSSYVGNTYVTLMDVNGDGLLDRVMNVYDSSLQDATCTSNYFYVQLNDGPFPDLLTSVSNGLGGVINVAYKPSTVWDNRKDPSNTNSYSTLPFPKQTVTTIIETDGINPPRTNTYSYAGGYYDGPRREFHGFAVVTNIDASLRKTITYYHQGGGRDYSALGEIADPGSFAKDGMAYRVESYGTDALLYKLVLNQVDQTNIGTSTYPRYFPFVSQSFDCDYPGGGSPRITGTKFIYSPTATDAKIFNLTQKVLWGEVTNITLTSIVAPTDVVAADTTTNVTTYAALNNTNILDHPDTVDLVDSANNVIQETKYAYDQTSGEITAKLTRISAGNYATNSYGNYNNYGLATSKTDPVGVQTSITAFDSTYTYPTTITVGGSFTTTASYDARSGLETGITDPMGVTVTNTYDTFYRLTESDKIPAGGTSVWIKKVGYNLGIITNGNAVSYIAQTNNDGVGGVESRTYVDGLGRPVQDCIQGENGNYRVVTTAYDERGNAFLSTWPVFGSSGFNKPSGSLTATWTGYDAAGRAATNRPVTASFNSSTGAFSSKTDLSGDTGSPLGPMILSYVNGTDPWWITCTDADGKVRRYGLDAFGRTNQIQEVDGGSIYNTTLKYDLAGNLTNIVNANTQSIYFAYNDAGGLVAMADPHLGQWIYVRDYAGRLRMQTDGRGNVVSNSYVNSSGSQDPLGRLQVQTIFGTNYSNHVLIPAFTNTYFYDTNNTDNSAYPVYNGLLYEVTDSEGWEKNGYDPRGRLIKTARHLNINNQTYTNSFTYNDGDKVTSVTYPNGGPVVTNAYFTGGTIQQVSRIGGSSYYTVSAANIDEFGHVTSFAYGNGLTTTRSYYSTSKRLSSITCGSVFSRTYTYTTNDDVASITGTGITNVTVTYDNLHRIKTFTGLSGSYGYDSVGNITTNIESGSAVAYSYANPRKQAVRTAFGYTNLYDLCGNMIVRHGGLTNSQAMVYDADNRLKVFSQAGKVVVEFGYAADGTRLWKRVDQNTNQVQIWIGNTYEEKNDTNGVHKVLFHVYAGGQQVCTFEPTSTLNGGNNTTNVGYYYHEDNLNSSSALSGPTAPGSQIEVDSYYPFGRTLTANPQTSLKVSRQFTGQIKDDETGLYYYNARYYDPELGRFIQADDRIPDLSNPQSYNRYSYVANNPLAYTDPSGHSWVPWWEEVKGQWAVNEMVQKHTEYGNYTQFMAARQKNAIPTAGDLRSVTAGAHAAGGMASAYITVEASIVAPEARMAAGGTKVEIIAEGQTAKQGLSQFSRASEFGIKSYNDLRKLTSGTGLEAHHIIEQRFAALLGKDAGDMSAVALTRAEHAAFTKAWRQAIPYGQGTANATVEQVRAAAQQIYKNYPELLKSAQSEFK
jgi:RHS repeat-associated protein